MLELTDSVTMDRFQKEVESQGNPPLDCYISCQIPTTYRDIMMWKGPLDTKVHIGTEALDINAIDLLFGSLVSEHNLPLDGIDLNQAVCSLTADFTKKTMHRRLEKMMHRRLVVEGDHGFLCLAIGPVGLLGHISDDDKAWFAGLEYCPKNTIISFAFLEKHGCPFDYDRYGWGYGR